MYSNEMYDAFVKQMNILADEVEGCFSDNTVKVFRVDVKAGEACIALEMLIENIYEYDIVVSELAYKILEKASTEELEEHYAKIVSKIRHE